MNTRASEHNFQQWARTFTRTPEPGFLETQHLPQDWSLDPCTHAIHESTKMAKDFWGSSGTQNLGTRSEGGRARFSRLPPVCHPSVSFPSLSYGPWSKSQRKMCCGGAGRRHDYGATVITGMIFFAIAFFILVIVGGALLGVGLRDANQGLIVAGAVGLGLSGLTFISCALFACWNRIEDCCCPGR